MQCLNLPPLIEPQHLPHSLAVTPRSTTQAAIPTGGNILMIRATDAVWIRFGATGVGAAAADANSILFIGGEAPYVLKSGDAFFRVLRVGAADVAVQLESVATL